jgi:outer membrane protein assembly factor BamB
LKPFLCLPPLFLALLLSSGLLPVPAAQVPAADEQFRKIILPGEARDLLGRLRAADALIRKKAYADGIDEYLRLIAENGDELVPEEAPREAIASTRRSVQLRRLCHARIAVSAPPALRHYRARVDPRARRWLKDGTDAHDTRALRRVVDEAFCSSFAGQAIDLLGDLAFEKGNFAEARGWWRLLALPASDAAPADPGARRFPDPQVDVARVRAKQVIALLFEGELRQAREDLTAIRKLHGQASGRLAGRTGNYADILQSLVAERLKRGPLSPEEEDWPTFAGSPSRNRVLNEALSQRLWANGPAWRVRLGGAAGEGDEPAGERAEARTAPGRRLAFHPVIAGRRVLVADARFITAYDLDSGRRLFRYDVKAPGRPGLDGLRMQVPAPPDVRYTLSIAEGRVYARLGTQLIGPQKKEAPGEPHPASYLVCLDLPAAKAGKPAAVKERWVAKASRAAGAEYVFEGAPLVYDGRVYVAETCWAGGRLRTAVSCRDADSGALRWRQEVCEVSDADEEPAPRVQHHLLTLAGTSVVYCAHAGAVISLDGQSGRRLWGVRYPSRRPGAASTPAPRDLAPCVAVGRRLFVAPLDSDRILCLDVETGRTLWEREGMDVVHLLGVSAGRLIFTTTGGIRALAAATGADDGGWRQPALGRLPAFGRGLLAGGWVLWPTQDPRLPLRALNEADGGQERGSDLLDPTRLHRLRPGNMAPGGGCLVVADTEELIGYTVGKK